MSVKIPGLINKYLLVKPSLRMPLFELPMMIVIGIVGEIFSWTKIPLSPYSNIVGGIIIIGGFVFHIYCHRVHKQAHDQSHQIDEIVTTGVFSRIRHPIYLSLIIIYFGLMIAWGVVWMFIPFLLLVALTVITAIQEEELLLQRFGPQYEQYMKETPWRLIPGLF